LNASALNRPGFHLRSGLISTVSLGWSLAASAENHEVNVDSQGVWTQRR
jgi:hypothetical protein